MLYLPSTLQTAEETQSLGVIVLKRRFRKQLNGIDERVKQAGPCVMKNKIRCETFGL